MTDSGERQQLVDLLCDLAAGEPEARAREAHLGNLLQGQEDLDLDSFERAAAAIQLAGLPPVQDQLPAGLRNRLLGSAEAFSETFESGARPDPALPSAPATRENRPAGPALPSVPLWMGWLIAAAASLALFVQVNRSGGSDPLTLERVLGEGDAVQIAWSATEDPDAEGVTGEVVWSNALQQGFMRFEGLPENDPNVGQYQLWIFDADRPEETPVDGGVFDVTEDSALVPIDAKLDVDEPTLFAVTWEKPGGVVVSERERILLVASR